MQFFKMFFLTETRNNRRRQDNKRSIYATINELNNYFENSFI